MECDFDGYFDQQVRELEGSAEKNLQRAPQAIDPTPLSSSDSGNQDLAPPLSGLAAVVQKVHLSKPQANGYSTDVAPMSTPDTSRPVTPAGNIITGKGGPKSRRARKAAAAPANASSGDERKPKPKKEAGKKMRQWDADGLAVEDDGTVLDYSTQATAEEGTRAGEGGTSVDTIDSQSFGTRTAKGQYVLKDLDSEVHSILQGANDRKAELGEDKAGIVGSGFGAISGLFRNVIGGKVLTKEDLAKAMKGMEEHLLNKNIAREAAVRLCEGVERELAGVKTGSFESMSTMLSHAPVYESTDMLPRRRDHRPQCHGIIPPQNSYANHFSRHPPLHHRCHVTLKPEPSVP